jgi:NAD(P)-dependent dehydrogenase (short-subunit alcohol dehydrogenase family)
MTQPVNGFSNEWVLVSGATSGIGRAIAVELVRHGARVVLIGRRRPQLEETAAKCGDASRSQVLELDLGRTEQIAPAITALAARIGRVYGLCHSAGLVQTLPLAATKPERLRAMMEVNLVAGLELARALTRREVLDEQGGSILWIASIYAHVGAPGQIGYAATKGAITSAVRSMALELVPRKVRVNCISPGLVKTSMTDAAHSRMSVEQWARLEALHPLGAGQPEDIARAAVFMLDPRNRWMTGSDLVIDGGYTLQ